MLLTYIYIYIYIYIYLDIVPDVPDTSGESKNNIGAAFGGPKTQQINGGLYERQKWQKINTKISVSLGLMQVSQNKSSDN